MGAVGMRLRSERIVTPLGTIGGEVAISDGLIDSLGPRAPGVPDDEVIDLGQRWIVPGYIDTHVHGGGGAQCNTTEPDEIATVARFHAGHGTTALLATTVAAPVQELVGVLGAIADAVRGRGAAVRVEDARGDGAAVLGTHLEGPFLSAKRPGAMDPGMFIDPNPEVVAQLLSAGRDTVRWMTFAPELPGALGLVRTLADADVVASIGHSDATYDTTCAAVRAGARAATHAFNAMRPYHHRGDPGVLGAVLDLPEVSCELICDGFHVQPVALRLVYRTKGVAGVRLVTDAMQAAGMADGSYRLGSSDVTVTDGHAMITGGASIAGSTLTMGEAVKNAVRFLGVGVEDAVVMASGNPARLLGLGDRKGAVAEGMDADLAILDDDLSVSGTVVRGVWVHGPPA
jgi:N-acetylglucosamine-6-phosphate deacetylase